jgi:hypothetical protein
MQSWLRKGFRRGCIPVAVSCLNPSALDLSGVHPSSFNQNLTLNSQVLNLSTVEGERREVMGDPILFWTLFAVITANIIVLVVAFMNAIRVTGRFRREQT